MRISSLATVFSVVVLLLFVGGCSGEKRPDGLPELYPLTVKITQQGTPLVDGSVRFISTDPASGGVPRWSVSGVTNAKGEAVMKTHGFPGSPIGPYKVVVSKEEIGYDNGDPPQVTSRLNLVLQKYTGVSTTDLKIDVTADMKTAEFDVGAPVREEMATPP